ncbi:MULTISPECIES: beta-propeller domain-containing protein [Lysinibacillus]|uniref:beta-propeller domain-containing protein n=1 Tax=Lysinibacillus TaxID=400634 RepID=UPI00214B9101|nr:MULTISPECIES: beta-propeller domain-containing protein [Lysinibacillus]UUV24885.1 beta-propeller domain-containing protein [Lysinibacillus sp. FN11]UYB47756.1 beta-propeller domain-containing protein [Lysinibacillus capsici]
MMKSKWFAIMLIIVLAIVPGIFTWIVNTDVTAKAASASMATQNWQASFSVALKKNKITEEYVYITTEKGRKVPATIELLEDQKTIVVKKLAPGNYQLHVKKEAFAQGGLNVASQTIPFTIIETLTAVKTEKELQHYFKKLLTTQRVEIREDESLQSAASEDKATANNESTTNNQVEGVEEGDIVIVKDGFIYTAKDQSITVVNAKDPNNLKMATSIKLKDSQYISKLALYDNLLIAIGDQYIEKAGTAMVTASIYDISNPSNPKHVRDVGQEGFLQDIRITKDTLYLIGNMYPNYWMLQEDKKTDLKPKTFDSIAGTEYKSLPLEKISILPNTMDGTYSLITAVDLKNGAKTTANTKGYLGGSSGLYMSENALYLTTPMYESNIDVSSEKRDMDMIWLPRSADTQIFKWNVDGTTLNFVGSTEVKGTVLNQYSMDEYKGNFRIFTTEGNTWNEKSTSYNHLFILDEHLKTLGSVKDMAPGEKIYSARFMGEKAYVVTFKQVDPLFVIDVANPKKPAVLGELKIPGFSNYLHPLDDTHLIGIGYDTEQRYDSYTKRNFTVTTNMKMSLFDVSDFRNPKEQSTVKIGGKGSSSEVQYNPKALFRNKEFNYFGFPVVLYEAGKGDEVVYQGHGAQIYEITAEKGIVLKGNIINRNNNESYESWERVVQRVVYIDDTLYTIARNEVKSYQLSDFKPLDTLTIK